MIQKSVPLKHTPRKLIKHPEHAIFYTIESDNNTLPPDVREKLLADPERVNGDVKMLPPDEFGYPRGQRHWSSCISVVDPLAEDGPQVLQSLDLDGNEAATSAAVVRFANQDNNAFLIVGTGKDMVMVPRKFSEGYVHVYRFEDDGRRIEFIHKTKVEEPPTAIMGFQGRVAVGIGKMLRIYDLGLRKMLRKAQAEVVPNVITSLDTQGNRIVVGDVQQGITCVVYKQEINKLIPFVNDTIARWTTCSTMVDYESVAGGDKFGNLFIVRCPEKASDEADADTSGAQLLCSKEYLHGAPHRLNLVSHFYAQDMPTSIAKVTLSTGARDLLIWSGLMGTIGVLIPFVNREDADFFQSLEQHMRTEDPPLAGRDHLIYRGYYVPVKGAIDGDLCERFSLLPREKKQLIAGELDRTVREIERKISVGSAFFIHSLILSFLNQGLTDRQDLRTRSAF